LTAVSVDPARAVVFEPLVVFCAQRHCTVPEFTTTMNARGCTSESRPDPPIPLVMFRTRHDNEQQAPENGQGIESRQPRLMVFNFCADSQQVLCT
jgi:hypothetical protein